MISNHISDILTAAKELPNSLERNKLISHLNDAYFVAYYIEAKGRDKLAQSNVVGIDIENIEKQLSEICICPAGSLDTACPIHGR